MATIVDNILVFNGAIQHKRGSKQALEASDYVPRSGELLVATDTGDIRVGDGLHSWRDLPAPSSLEGIIGIDCGEVTAPVNNG